MKTCPQCAEEVQDAAKVCRYCGHSFEGVAPPRAAPAPAPPLPKSKNRGCLIAVAIVVVILIALGMLGQQQQQSGNGTKPQAAAEPATPPLAVTATEVFQYYQSNEAAAQAYYGDRPLLVSGEVVKVDLDLFNNPVVLLRTPNQFMSAHASLTKEDQPKAIEMGPGHRVKLLCQGVSEVVATPMFKDCSVQSDRP